MSARSIVLVGCAACSSPATPSPDAQPPSIAYTLHVGRSPGTRTELPQIFIDGVETAAIDESYPDLASAAGFRHTVELRYADHLLASSPTSADTIGCTNHVNGDLTSVSISLDSTTPCATTCLQPDGYPHEAAFCM